MGRYECRICHGTCDPGELVGGVCGECRERAEEESQRQIAARSVAGMMNGQPYQMGMEVMNNDSCILQ